MTMTNQIAQNINILGSFCGKRDISTLTSHTLETKYGIRQADVMVLFGGSILCGGDILAEGMKNKIAKKYIIVGGEGHTTDTLRRKMQELFPDVRTAGLQEAELFDLYLKRRHRLRADFLECRSTNCGNNITYLLELLKDNQIACDSIILSQDATMQHRMEAGLRKYADMAIINYATYSARVESAANTLRYAEQIWGMWDMERYIRLLMGEIPRLADDENGYGPRGKDFIAHVDIPREVTEAFEALKLVYGDTVRAADPAYASVKSRPCQ